MVSPLGYYATDITLATRSNPETNQRVLDHIPANRWGDTQDFNGRSRIPRKSGIELCQRAFISG